MKEYTMSLFQNLKQFRIGTFCFDIEYPSDFCLPANFLLFESSDGIPQYHYHIYVVDKLPQLSRSSGQAIAERDDLLVLQTPSGEARVIGAHGSDIPYALYQETSETSADIYFLDSCREESHVDTMFTSLLALERRFMQPPKGAACDSVCGLILHCAYICYQGEAILFSAPSETGKSTQADLWEKYRGSRTINGDRALLQKKDGRWTACGWPICGSSEICHNEETPIKAIVMLSQSPENACFTETPMSSFRKLYSQITINSWNPEAVNRAMELIGDLQASIPVYHLACNISEEAVVCLESMLF